MKYFCWNDIDDKVSQNRIVFCVLHGRKSIKDNEKLTICIKKDWINQYKSLSNNKKVLFDDEIFLCHISNPEYKLLDENIKVNAYDYNSSKYCGFTLILEPQNSLMDISRRILKEVVKNMKKIEEVKSYKLKIIIDDEEEEKI